MPGDYWQVKVVLETEYVPEDGWEPFAVTEGGGHNGVRSLKLIWLRKYSKLKL